MWYITIVFILSIFSIIEFDNKGKRLSFAFKILWAILTLMLMVRYGQGTDYYGYYVKYDLVDLNGAFFINSLDHGEIGWYILILLSKKMGLHFFSFVGIVSLTMMMSLYRFVRKYSIGGVFSLLLLFPTYYLTYCYSAMRQGLVMTIFLGFGIDLLLKRKYLHYYVLIFVLTLLHTSAIIFVLLPVAINWHGKKLLVFLGVVAAFIFVSFFVRRLKPFSAIGYEGDAGIGGIILRVLLLSIVWFLYRKTKMIRNEKIHVELLFRIYLTGFIIFVIFSASGTLSQRISMPFKAVEVALLPSLLYSIGRNFTNRNKMSKVVIAFYAVLLIANVEFVKNIYSYIDQGNYREWVTPMNYPYISVFDQNEINKYITNFDEEV